LWTHKSTSSSIAKNDGRWIAEAVDLPGVLAYGSTKEEARGNAEGLARQVMEERESKARR